MGKSPSCANRLPSSLRLQHSAHLGYQRRNTFCRTSVGFLSSLSPGGTVGQLCRHRGQRVESPRKRLGPLARQGLHRECPQGRHTGLIMMHWQEGQSGVFDPPAPVPWSCCLATMGFRAASSSDLTWRKRVRELSLQVVMPSIRRKRVQMKGLLVYLALWLGTGEVGEAAELRPLLVAFMSNSDAATSFLFTVAA